MDRPEADGNADTSEQYGTVELTDRGRLTIPESLRQELQLDEGVEFTVVREGCDIHLVRKSSGLDTVTRGEEWGEEAFRDAGAATFGDR